MAMEAGSWGTRARDERGVSSLFELLVVASLMIVVVGAVMAFFNTAVGQQTRAETNVRSLAQQRLGLDRMVREIRQASSVGVYGSPRTLVVGEGPVPGQAGAQTQGFFWWCFGSDCWHGTAYPVGSPWQDVAAEIEDVRTDRDIFTYDPASRYMDIALSADVNVTARDARLSNPSKPVELHDGFTVRNVSP